MSIEGDIASFRAAQARREAHAAGCTSEGRDRLLAAAAMHELQAKEADARERPGNVMGWIWSADTST